MSAQSCAREHKRTSKQIRNPPNGDLDRHLRRHEVRRRRAGDAQAELHARRARRLAAAERAKAGNGLGPPVGRRLAAVAGHWEVTGGQLGLQEVGVTRIVGDLVVAGVRGVCGSRELFELRCSCVWSHGVHACVLLSQMLCPGGQRPSGSAGRVGRNAAARPAAPAPARRASPPWPLRAACAPAAVVRDGGVDRGYARVAHLAALGSDAAHWQRCLHGRERRRLERPPGWGASQSEGLGVM